MPRIDIATREARRRRLIEAAWRCASSTSYRNWTVDDVCDQAGVSKGAFYGYFAGKGELLVAMVEDDAAWVDDLIVRLDASPAAGSERLRRFVDAVLKRREDPGRVQLRADLWSEMLADPSVREPFVGLIRRRRLRVQSWIDSNAGSRSSAKALASIVLALIDGLTLHRALDPTAFQWANVRGAVDGLLSGLERDRT